MGQTVQTLPRKDAAKCPINSELSRWDATCWPSRIVRRVELIFVRHGRPEHVVTNDGSPADPPLSDVGHEQAAAVADWLGEEEIHAIYSSPMQRARQTAAPIEVSLGMQATIREGISEFDRDSVSYVPTEVLKKTDRDAWLKMASGDFMAEMGDPAAWVAHVVATVEAIVESHPGQRVAVVCHGGVVNAYLAHCLDFAAEDFMRFDVDYTSVTRCMASTRGHRSVIAINERTHFRGRPGLAIRD